MREHVLRVTIKDCEVQTFRCGGKGGQNKDKRDTGVRIIHHPSGGVAESREARSQLGNKRRAFERLGRTMAFQVWCRSQATSGTIKDKLAEDLQAESIEVEYRVNGQWKKQ